MKNLHKRLLLKQNQEENMRTRDTEKARRASFDLIFLSNSTKLHE